MEMHLRFACTQDPGEKTTKDLVDSKSMLESDTSNDLDHQHANRLWFDGYTLHQ